MSKDFDKVVLEWKAAHENEHKGMKSEQLDPKNKEHIEEYRATNPKPPGFAVCKQLNLLK